MELEKTTQIKLNTIQTERLNLLLSHAIKNIPFYKERITKTTNPVLSDFPVLTKKDIRNHYLDLMTPELRTEYQTGKKNFGYSWIEVKTGGSTGIPTSVIHDREFRDRGRAARLYSQYLCGFPFGTPYFKCWGSMRDINQTKDSVKNRIMSFLSREILLNAFKMNDKDIAQYINMINNSKINHIMGYVDAVYQLARYIQKTDTKIRPIKSIMACAGTVTDDIRILIEKTFDAKLHNKYGSRDCSDMACECDKGGLHIYSNYVLIEVLDSSGNPLSSGKEGRILVTLLGNFSFPLIRYEIGDVGALSSKSCDCGRPFPLIEKLEGRTVEFLVNNHGGYVTPAYIIHLIGVVHNPGFIKRFQLVQLSLKELELKLELETKVSDDIYNKVVSEIIRDLKSVFGENCDILPEIVQNISETASGKFIYTINKYKPFI